MLLNQIRTVVEVYQHLPRYRQIFHVFFKYRFGDILKMIHLQKILEIKEHHLPGKDKDLHSKPIPERFRMALLRLAY